jgi:predicted negative regulator of RcsB-dependent stress response
MAERDPKQAEALPGGDDAETQAEWQRALEYTKNNPTKVVGGIGFLLLCVVIGGVFSLQQKADEQRVTTEYAAALSTEDPGLRAAELEKLTNKGNRWSVEALYQMGEAAVEAKTYDKAREAFGNVLSNHSDSVYAPMAADGIAFLDENDGELEKALQGYTGVFEKWDATITGRREPFNIARVNEELGNIAEAITWYKRQGEVFPDSVVAGKSEAALDRLKVANPELFPEEETVDNAEAEAAPAVVSTSAEPAPAEPAPAEPAPAEPAPAEPAPAEPAPAEAAPAEPAPAPAAEADAES